jgi:prepilin-type N-terminal cleavage/methylation domain-containing protein
MRSPRHSRETGFTLVEMMVAITVVLVGVLGTVSLVDGANRTSGGTRAREGATNLARDVIEGMHNLPTKKLVAAGADLPAMIQGTGVGGTTGAGGWKVNRRNFTYTVQVTACAFDDPQDGSGQLDTTRFTTCQGSTTGTSDRNPLDYARVSVTVSWTERSTPRQVRQAAVLNNTSDGPAIVTLSSTSVGVGDPTAPLITNSALTQISFQATTDEVAAWADWYLNGTYKDRVDDAGGGKTWTWTWDLKTATGSPPCSSTPGGVVDGTYLVGVEAFDRPEAIGSEGLSAGQKALTVSLNRCPALAPTGLVAVRSILFDDVELAWDPNPEADVLGYHVYRNGALITCSGASTVLVKTPQCNEPDPGGTVTYEVRAVDRDKNGNLREGPAGAASAPALTNNPPSPPTGIAPNGTTSTLVFKTPASPQDSDFKDTVVQFNVYRDGQSPSKRYDSISNSGISAGSTVTWIDPSPGGVTHTYWVTAVDNHGAESSWNGSVTR